MIVERPSGNVKSFKPEQPLNALDQIVVTVSGIKTFVMPEQLMNASPPMIVTGFPPSVAGMVTAPVGTGSTAGDPHALKTRAEPSPSIV